MTTLLESRARPFGSRKGVAFSMLIHGALIAAAVFATGRVIIPPREKVEEHPVLYVAVPPPPPIEAPPKPLPKVATPPKAKQVFKAPPRTQRAPAVAPKPRAAPQVQPKGPTTPALVAPTKVPLSIPDINVKGPPTISDVVAPPIADPTPSSGIGTGGSVKRGEGNDGGGGKGLSSGSSSKAFDENQVDRAVEVSRKADPRYPDALKSVGVQGVVVMRFIVGPDGRVEPGSIEVVDSPQRLFSEAVRTALLNTRYRAAQVGGQNVRQLVEQSFAFRLR